jgi:8-amino-7-oxononanoate synthase
MARFLTTLHDRLRVLDASGLGRKVLPVEDRHGPMVRMDGKWLVDFSSNDILGIASDPDMAARIWNAVRPRRLGAGAARLVSGQSPELSEAEAALAAWCGAPDALLFPSATQANAAVASLFQGDDFVAVDKRVHGSILHGLSASRAQVRSFGHNRLSHLARILAEVPVAAVWSESLFSMDGDSPDIPAMAQYCREHDALLVLDEAHAVGVLGPHGKGLGEGYAPVRTVGLGKALGLVGGAVLGPPQVRRALLHLAPSAMFTTALPPWMGTLITAVVHEARQQEDRRRQVAHLADLARRLFQGLGVPVLGTHHILAVVLGSEARAAKAAWRLRDFGFLVFAARYPTVPLGAARLRVVITAQHTEEHLQQLAGAVAQVLHELSE